MSKGVNKWIGIGNACGDPETRYMPSGGGVTNLTIACNDGYKDKNTGQQVDATEFVRVVFFNKLSEIVSQYVKKGSKIYIEGKLRTRSWEQDGVKRYATEIVANEMQLLDSKNGGNGQQQGQQQAPQGQPQQSAGGMIDDDPFGDGIPFMTYMKNNEFLV